MRAKKVLRVTFRVTKQVGEGVWRFHLLWEVHLNRKSRRLRSGMRIEG